MRPVNPHTPAVDAWRKENGVNVVVDPEEFGERYMVMHGSTEVARFFCAVDAFDMIADWYEADTQEPRQVNTEMVPDTIFDTMSGGTIVR